MSFDIRSLGHHMGLVFQRVCCARVVAVQCDKLALAKIFEAREGEIDMLFFVSGIDNLHDVGLGGLVVHGTCVEIFMAFDRLSAFGETQNMGASVRGIKHLDIPVD